MSSFHTTRGYVAVAVNGLVGIWGVLMYKRDEPPRAFLWGVWVAIGALVLQVVLGVLVAALVGGALLSSMIGKR